MYYRAHSFVPQTGSWGQTVSVPSIHKKRYEIMNIWRINVNSQQFSIEDVPTSWKHLGGRGLLAKILLDEVTPTCDPLGPHNKLVFSPGLLVGHRLSSLDRISIGGKSPLTGGVKEANAGGRTGYHLARLGIKALIIEDRPIEDNWQIIYLSKDSVRFDDAAELVGGGVYDSASQLRKKYGDQVAVALIGPGGEKKMRAAGIQNIDIDYYPSRIAARGGLGAVMGQAMGQAMMFDIRIHLENSFVRRRVRLMPDAPSTFLIPISLVRCSEIKFRQYRYLFLCRHRSVLLLSRAL